MNAWISLDTLAAGLYQPPVAVLFVAAVVLLVLLSSAATARRERAWGPAILRFIAIAGLGWVLLGYSQTQPGSATDAQPPTLAVLIDTSASMAEQDAEGSPDAPAISRLQAVTKAHLSDEQLAKLRSVAEVQLLAFDAQLRPTSSAGLNAQGQATELMRALTQIDADATLILSDGHDTSTPITSQAIDTGRAGRLFAVPVGATRSAPDLSLQAWPDSDRLFEDQSTTLTASIQQSGMSGQEVQVELLLDGQIIQSQSITLDQRVADVRFQVSPPLALGQTVQANHYTAQVRLAQGDEANLDNNAQDVFIQTSRGQIKVLLLEGEPYWDTRALARLITSHPRFDLTAMYSFGESRRSSLLGQTFEGSAQPTNQLEAFDIVILGRQVQRLVDPGFSTRLTEFVRGGGAVVFARGQPFEPDSQGDRVAGASLLAGIESISPVRWAQPVLGEMRVRLGGPPDARGPLADLREGEVLSRLPGMLAATRIEGRKSASLVLLEQQGQTGPAMAALTSLRVGSGISMAVLTEGLWQWELLPGIDDQDTQAESIYGVLWIRALQWLASGGDFLPGQDIAIEADRLTAEPGQSVKLNISTRYVEADQLSLQLIATHADGSAQTLTPTQAGTAGTYAATFTPEKTGVYTFSLTTPQRPDLIDPDEPMTTRLAVIDRSPERRDTSAKPEALQQLVEPTGGQCLTLGQTQPMIDYLQTLQALRGSEDRVDYAFNTWPVFVLIAGCFGLEWILRRRSGLR